MSLLLRSTLDGLKHRGSFQGKTGIYLVKCAGMEHKTPPKSLPINLNRAYGLPRLVLSIQHGFQCDLYIYMNIYIYECIYIYIWLYTHTHIYIYMNIYIYIWMYIHICMHACRVHIAEDSQANWAHTCCVLLQFRLLVHPVWAQFRPMCLIHQLPCDSWWRRLVKQVRGHEIFQLWNSIYLLWKGHLKAFLLLSTVHSLTTYNFMHCNQQLLNCTTTSYHE